MVDTSAEFRQLMGEPGIERKPYLNLGAGRIILPAERPHHHRLVDEAIYAYPEWVNADRNAEPGIDRVVDLFSYPWPFEDNSFSGALASHIVEHIPHEIKPNTDGWVRKEISVDVSRLEMNVPDIPLINRFRELSELQDGWYAFFAELYRVLEHGAIVHILAPYGWSQGAITDPTHTRLVTEHTFSHSMQPDPNSPFKYETGGINFEMIAHSFSLLPHWSHLAINPGDTPEWIADKQYQFQRALESHINVVYEIYAQLRVVKA